MTEREKLIDSIKNLIEQINDIELLNCIYLLAVRLLK